MEIKSKTKHVEESEIDTSYERSLHPPEKLPCNEEISNKIISEICRVSASEKTDHFRSKEFFRDCIMNRLGIELRQFDSCLEELDIKGYLKITHHYRRFPEGEYAIPVSFQIMEEGKKYCLILKEN